MTLEMNTRDEIMTLEMAGKQVVSDVGKEGGRGGKARVGVEQCDYYRHISTADRDDNHDAENERKNEYCA